MGGCVATTLGAVIHELGHTLDLAHSDDGFMARGFDDLDKYFNCTTASAGPMEPPPSMGNLPRCGRGGGSRSLTPASMTMLARPTTILGQEGGTTYLEEYQRKKYYRRMMQECGNAFWDKSAAAILSSHP